MTDLVERVARTCTCHPSEAPVPCRKQYAFLDCIRAEARAIALEEAATVVTEHYQELSTEHRLLLLNRAAAIRAMIPNRNDPAQDGKGNAE
jgi:hypothetical protein